MIDYRTFTAEMFATDAFFRGWVLSPDAETCAFWEKWQLAHPGQSAQISIARELVLTVHSLYDAPLSDEKIIAETAEIARLARLRSERGRSIVFRPLVWRAAAAVVLAAGLGWMLSRGRVFEKTQVITQQAQVAADSMLVSHNGSGREMIVLLSDNSVVTLAKGSAIRYPRQFGSGERRVFLTGEAFFDVAKNPGKPFLVFANETVTKVLGTSFRVRAFENDATVTVLVKTGRVSVYPQQTYDSILPDATGTASGVVLTPNQQAIFNRDQNRLEKSIVSNPALLAESILPREVIFDDRPVTEVFRSLEKTYGIGIRWQADMLTNCRVNAQFSDENLKQRLNAVCDAIGATYEMVDGQVVIHAKGCI